MYAQQDEGDMADLQTVTHKTLTASQRAGVQDRFDAWIAGIGEKLFKLK